MEILYWKWINSVFIFYDYNDDNHYNCQFNNINASDDQIDFFNNKIIISISSSGLSRDQHAISRHDNFFIQYRSFPIRFSIWLLGWKTECEGAIDIFTLHCYCWLYHLCICWKCFRIYGVMYDPNRKNSSRDCCR